jgi:hypothetical protein
MMMVMMMMVIMIMVGVVGATATRTVYQYISCFPQLVVVVAESCVVIQRSDHEHDVDRGVRRPSVHHANGTRTRDDARCTGRCATPIDRSIDGKK